jgi:uncharacterized membrane protein YbhN (UPF0104 family)
MRHEYPFIDPSKPLDCLNKTMQILPGKSNVWRRFRSGKIPIRMILIILTTGALVIAAFYVPWQELLDALKSANPIWLLLAVIANATIFPFWLLQWKLLLPSGQDISWYRLFDIIAIGSIANNVLSSTVGIGSSVALLVVRGNLTLAGATSVLAMDQLLVGITKLSLIVLALLLIPEAPPEFARGAWAFALITLTFLVLY